MRPHEYRFINLFRALAAFWVLAAHCMIWGGWYGLPLPSAKLAVDLFMMISGFLMVANTSRGMDARKFWMRRLFRIAPAYYLSLLVAVVCQHWFLQGYAELQALNPGRWRTGGTYDPARIQYTAENIGLHLSFLFGLSPDYSFSTMLPDWSLGLEMQFYAVFPALAWAMLRYGAIRVAILACALALFVTPLLPHFREPSLLVLKLNYFVAGMLACHALTNRRMTTACAAIGLSALGVGYGVDAMIPAALMVAMLWMGRREIAGTSPAWVARITGSRLVTFASDVSYGVYLFHGFFIAACGFLFTNAAVSPPVRVAVMFALVTTGAYTAGWAVYRYIERPGIGLGKLISLRYAAQPIP